jgi:hypothetical protein
MGAASADGRATAAERETPFVGMSEADAVSEHADGGRNVANLGGAGILACHRARYSATGSRAGSFWMAAYRHPRQAAMPAPPIGIVVDNLLRCCWRTDGALGDASSTATIPPRARRLLPLPVRRERAGVRVLGAVALKARTLTLSRSTGRGKGDAGA